MKQTLKLIEYMLCKGKDADNKPSSSYRASLQVSYLLRGLGTFMHAPECKCSLVIKAAFTLAEILITLAIIGVIAALTLQPLIEKYKKLDTVTKLKKAYTTINEALRRSEAENGEYQFWESGYDLGAEEYLNKYWLPYFNVYKLCTSYSICGYKMVQPYYYINGNKSSLTYTSSTFRRPFITTDGISYSISVAKGSVEAGTFATNVLEIYIDINASKGPNTYGKDFFIFSRTDNGILPYCYSETDEEINKNCSSSGDGTCCSEKIRRAGWKIEDDYPW